MIDKDDSECYNIDVYHYDDIWEILFFRCRALWPETLNRQRRRMIPLMGRDHTEDYEENEGSKERKAQQEMDFDDHAAAMR